MLKRIGDVASLALIVAGLAASAAAMVSREIAPFEALLLWKAGLLGVVFFAFRLYELADQETVTIFGRMRRAAGE